MAAGTPWRESEPAAGQQARRLIEFAASAAHDIVGPVDQISSLVALFVQRYRGHVDNEAATLLGHIESARERLGITAAGLRKCFQVSASPCERARVDMNAALETALRPLGEQIAECRAEIHAGDLPAAEGDRELLVILFRALVENALKFRREGVVPVIAVSGEGSMETSIYRVGDNGIGIDPQYRELVFQSFRKINGHAYPGAGLGLTMAQFIVEMHGGSIWIEPCADGTEVCFRLHPAVG